jgi:KaiC/GvpD/RAD55 family RecA-like ATPase
VRTPVSTQFPSVHSVHIYENDDELISRLCAIVSTGLRLGDSVLIVATSEHREQLVRQLEEVGTDVRNAVRAGRYSMLDATEVMSTFLRDEWPDGSLFEQNVGGLLHSARKHARSLKQGLTVFGEMVAILWEQGNKEAALELERLWNRVLHDNIFHLHCAYPRGVVGDVSGLHAIEDVHTHLLQ